MWHEVPLLPIGGQGVACGVTVRVPEGVKAFEMRGTMPWRGGKLAAGNVLLVRPDRPPQLEDAVVVRLKGGELRCLVWRLALLQGQDDEGTPTYYAMSDVDEVLGPVVEVLRPTQEGQVRSA